MPRGQVDLQLAWRKSEDGSIRLGRGNLFLIAAREAYRPGSLAPEEKSFLTRLAHSLRLDEAAARKLLEAARADAKKGALEPGRFEPNEVFRKACSMAESDGHVDPKEKLLLEGLANALGIPEKSAQSTLLQLAVRVEAVPDPSGMGPDGFAARPREASGGPELQLDPERALPFETTGTLPEWARPREEAAPPVEEDPAPGGEIPPGPTAVPGETGTEPPAPEGKQAPPEAPTRVSPRVDLPPEPPRTVPEPASTTPGPPPRIPAPAPEAPVILQASSLGGWDHCRNHPDVEARVACPECRVGYCKECGDPVGREVSCPACRSLCLLPRDMETRERTLTLRGRGLLPELDRVARYPFVEGGTFWVLAAWAGCFYLGHAFAGTGAAGFWTLVLGKGVLVTYAFSALTRVSAGTFDRFAPEVDDLTGFVTPLRLAGTAALVSWGPMVLLGMGAGIQLGISAPSFLLLGLGFLWGVVYSPAAFIVAGMSRSALATLNPVAGLEIVQVLGLLYWQTTGLFLVLEVIRFLLALALGWIPLLGPFLGGVVDTYFLLAEGCLLGLALFKRAPELGLE